MTPFPHRCTQGGGGRRSSHWQIGKSSHDPESQSTITKVHWKSTDTEAHLISPRWPQCHMFENVNPIQLSLQVATWSPLRPTNELIIASTALTCNFMNSFFLCTLRSLKTSVGHGTLYNKPKLSTCIPLLLQLQTSEHKVPAGSSTLPCHATAETPTYMSLDFGPSLKQGIMISNKLLGVHCP